MEKNLIKLRPNLPNPPKELEGPALEKWWELARDLSSEGLLDEPEDEAYLAELAPLLVESEGLYRFLDTNGAYYTTKTGTIRSRPEVKRNSKLTRRATKLLSLLGLTPLGRAKREERKRRK